MQAGQGIYKSMWLLRVHGIFVHIFSSERI